jgi:hypothetical protein
MRLITTLASPMKVEKTLIKSITICYLYLIVSFQNIPCRFSHLAQKLLNLLSGFGFSGSTRFLFADVNEIAGKTTQTIKEGGRRHDHECIELLQNNGDGTHRLEGHRL